MPSYGISLDNSIHMIYVHTDSHIYTEIKKTFGFGEMTQLFRALTVLEEEPVPK